MRFILIALIFILTFFWSCKEENFSPTDPPQSITEIIENKIVGTWTDTLVHGIIVGDSTYFYYSASYTFFADRSFTAENELPFFGNHGGTWDYNRDSMQVLLDETNSDPIVIQFNTPLENLSSMEACQTHLIQPSSTITYDRVFRKTE